MVDLLKLPSESYCSEIDHLDRLLHVVDVTKQPWHRLPSLLSSLSCVTLFLAIEKKNITIWVLNGNDVQVRESEIDERSRALGRELNLAFDSLVQAAYPLLENEVHSLSEGCALKAEVIRRERDESMKEALKMLYDVVIKPVEDLLTGDEIIIVPDGRSVERRLQHSSTHMIDTYVNLTEYD